MVAMRLKMQKTEDTRTYWLSRMTFCVCFFVSVGLIVGGFFVPPMGVIDGSVLTRAIELGLRVKFQKGETSIEISKRKEDEDANTN